MIFLAWGKKKQAIFLLGLARATFATLLLIARFLAGDPKRHTLSNGHARPRLT